MISEIRIKNFRLLRDVHLVFEPGVPVVLIGPNSSGKSTLLEVFDLISFAVEHGLHQAVNQVRKGMVDIRTADCLDDVSIELLIDSREGWATEKDGGPIRYSLAFTEQQGMLSISSEELAIYRHGLNESSFQVLSRRGTRTYVHNIQTRKNDVIDIQPDQLALTAIQQNAFYPTLANVRKVLELTTVYTHFLTTPAWGRGSREQDISPRNPQYLVSTPRIDKRGLELVTALYHIYTNHKKTAWFQLEKHFKSEFPFVDELMFPPTSRGGDIALAWKDRRFPDTRFLAGQMSEGMIHFLCLLAAILVPDAAAALGFDEPDNNIHPSAVKRLVRLFERRAEQTTVLVATHSNQFLNHLSEPAKSVVVCIPTENGSEFHQLDSEKLEAWRKEYSLSQLREQGSIDPANQDLEFFS